MSKHYDGGPVFPREGGRKFVVGNDVRVTTSHDGMTLRDYFAAKAMQAYLTLDAELSWPLAVHADSAYKVADAMLEEREK